MTDIQKLKEIIGRCGIAGSKVLSHEAEGEQYKETKGAIISLPIHEESKPKFDELNTFIHEQKFISIEENIFGYNIKSTKMP